MYVNFDSKEISLCPKDANTNGEREEKTSRFPPKNHFIIFSNIFFQELTRMTDTG